MRMTDCRFSDYFYSSEINAVFIFRRIMVERKTTKQLLAESFKELAETTPVNKITIQVVIRRRRFTGTLMTSLI